MLADMNLSEADTWAEVLLGEPTPDPAVDVLGECLAADVRENDELDQADLVHRPHLGQQRIVRSYQRLVIEGLLQPLPHWLEAAEVHDPTASIEVISLKLQVHGESVAVEKSAVRWRPPLPEAAGQADIVAIGLRASKPHPCIPFRMMLGLAHR